MHLLLVCHIIILFMICDDVMSCELLIYTLFFYLGKTTRSLAHIVNVIINC